MILYVILFLLFCLAAVFIGRYVYAKRLREYADNFDFYRQFYDTFIDFVESRQAGRSDLQKFGWLLTNMDRMQDILGHIGMARYSNPYRNEVINNYAIILNEVSKLNDNYLERDTIPSIQRTLLRYDGITRGEIDATRKQAENYLKCFSEGITQIVSVPLYVLSAFNLFSSSAITSIINSKIYRALAGLIIGFGWLIGFSSDFVTVLGYEPVKNYIVRQFARDTIKVDTTTKKRVTPATVPKSQAKQPLPTQLKLDSSATRTAPDYHSPVPQRRPPHVN